MAAVAFHPTASPFVPGPPPASATVILDRVSFDILVRRANLNHNEGLTSSSLPKLQSVECIFIPKAEHVNLLATADRYACLQRHLINGGVTPATIQLLSEGETPAALPRSHQLEMSDQQPRDGNPALSKEKTFNRNSSEQLKPHTMVASKDKGTHVAEDYKNRSFGLGKEWAEDDHPEVDDLSDHGPAPEVQMPALPEPGPAQLLPAKQGPLFPKDAQRTLMLMGLAQSTSLAEVTAAVRGGPLLNVHTRQFDRCALVSFIYQEHAADFFNYVKRFGLLLNNKWVTVRWADKQAYLNGHTAFQIRSGATRNMVIRRCNSRHTEASIREDLEHIHNLVTISVEFLGGSCYIRTNSVQHAIVARTCMMSRQKYMGSGIEWDVDECARSLDWPEQVAQSPVHAETLAAKGTIESENFFTPLRVDDDDNQSPLDDASDADFTSTCSTGTAV